MKFNDYLKTTGVQDMAIAKSAGLVIVVDNEMLLVHPTGASWGGTFSFPKGKLEDFETPLEAALRETKEEIGLDMSYAFMLDPRSLEPNGVIKYKNNKGKTYKRVYYYVLKLEKKPAVDKANLQLDEVDWVGWVDRRDFEERLFWRFMPIVEEIWS